MDPAFSAFYRTMYEKHWWFRMREHWLVQILQRHQPQQGWLSILDVGCGDALFFDELAKFGEVEGVEPCGDIVNPGGPHSKKIHIARFDRDFQPGKQYNLILLLDVLEHLQRPDEALEVCRRLLHTGGTVLITVPAFRLAWTNHDVINHHVTRYRRSTLFPLLRSAGFRIDESAYWFQWTLPLRLLQGPIERIFRLPPGNPGIPPPFVNRALCAFCAVEHILLGPLHIPFGTTLFVRCQSISGPSAT